jgi:hypothetical protein
MMTQSDNITGLLRSQDEQSSSKVVLTCKTNVVAEGWYLPFGVPLLQADTVHVWRKEAHRWTMLGNGYR